MGNFSYNLAHLVNPTHSSLSHLIRVRCKYQKWRTLDIKALNLCIIFFGEKYLFSDTIFDSDTVSEKVVTLTYEGHRYHLKLMWRTPSEDP